MGTKDTTSAYRYQHYDSVDRTFLAHAAFKKISQKSIKYSDVLAVIGILFEELGSDIAKGIKIRIRNFGFFYVQTYPARMIYPPIVDEPKMGKATQKFRFHIEKKISNFIMNNLDIAKTFEDVYVDD
jgi:nucleoid DNA-binding protein